MAPDARRWARSGPRHSPLRVHRPQHASAHHGALTSPQVGAIWSSPLARCVQTAMVALQPLTASGAVSVELKPMARERRELTNLHTSIGNSFGEHIRTRCLAKSREVMASDCL